MTFNEIPVVLASSSTYRRALLERLGIPFECCSPNVDESPRAGEPPESLALRLAENKAQALATRFPEHLVIGSDQVAAVDQRTLGKPLEHKRAREQLRASSGRVVSFFTGLCVLNTRSGTLQSNTIRFDVHFRTLDDQTIERYLLAEKPYECAGSFKAEGLGIALFERMQGDDPTSLIGLPLIQLVDMLAREGWQIP